MAKGSIRKRGNKYQLTVDTGVDEKTGKRRRHYSTYRTESDAQRALVKIIEEVEKGTYVKETNETVYDFLAEWFATSRRHLRPTTAYVYERYLSLMESYLPAIKAKDLKKKQAEEIINALLNDYAPSTVAYCRRLLSTAFNRGVDWEVIVKNPFKSIPIKQPKREYTVWTPEQIQQFMATVQQSCESRRGNWSYYVAFMLALHAGMRKSEILGLRWSNVDIANRMIYVREGMHQMHGTGEKYISEPKSLASNRAIWIDDIIADELCRHLERQKEKRAELPLPPNDYVITTNEFNPIHPRNLTQALFRAIQSAELPRLRFHDLRHTHASLLLSTGISPKVTQERLGHARIETTMNTYSHVFPSMQQEAADKIGELLSAKPSAERLAVRKGHLKTLSE